MGEQRDNLPELTGENKELLFFVFDPLEETVDCGNGSCLGCERTKCAIQLEARCHLERNECVQLQEMVSMINIV